MRKKKPRVATLNEVAISREGEDAIIEFHDPAISTTHLKIGTGIERMADEQILGVFNSTVTAMQQMADDYEHVAVEIPPGRPQVEYFEPADQWTPRGDVLRCVVSDGGPDAEATVHIDDREFSLSEFGRILTTYAGWGMRITFVPEDDVEREPAVEVREPD